MPHALFAFNDPAAARRAMDRLIERGVVPADVSFHGRERGTSDDLASEADELATGGFVRSFLDLFEGLFEWDGEAGGAQGFTQLIQRGGAVLGVRSQSQAEQAKVEEVMTMAAPDHRTAWQDGPARAG